MGKYKRMLEKWQGYTIADCACEFCAYYAGGKAAMPAAGMLLRRGT